MSKANEVAAQKVWDSYTQEERQARIRANPATNRSLLSKEGREGFKQIATKNLLRGKERMSDEDWRRRNEKAGESIAFQIASLTPEEKEARLRNSFLSEDAMNRSRIKNERRWDSRLPEEKLEILRKSFLNPEVCKRATQTIRSERVRCRISESVRVHWDNLPEEQKESHRKRCSVGQLERWKGLPRATKEEFIRNSVIGNRPPTFPELVLQEYLEREFPGKWLYNGDKRAGIVIGTKIPDFVAMDGVKAVIEVFGAYWHDEDEVDKKVDYYKGYGYRCLVLWDYECILEQGRLQGLVTELTT